MHVYPNIPSSFPPPHPPSLSCPPTAASPSLTLSVIQCRTLISDFSIIISILVFCVLDFLLSLDTPKLHVPTEIKVPCSSFTAPFWWDGV